MYPGVLWLHVKAASTEAVDVQLCPSKGLKEMALCRNWDLTVVIKSRWLGKLCTPFGPSLFHSLF